MIIIDDTKITKRFGDIRIGTVFKYEPEGSQPEYYIKVPSMLDQRSQHEFNAINLEDGSWNQFADYENICPYDATLHLEL